MMLRPDRLSKKKKEWSSRFSPANQGFKLWLDNPAIDSNVNIVSGVVSQYNDISGNNNNFPQTTALDRPARVGNRVIADGSSDLLDGSANIANFIDSQGEFIVVFTDFEGSGNFCLPICFGDASDDATFIIFGIIPADKINIQTPVNNIQWDLPARSETYIINFISTGMEYKCFLNGVDLGTPTVSSGANDGDWIADVVGLDTFTLFTLSRPAPIFTNTGISSVLYKSPELTTSVRDDLFIYLNKRLELGL